MIRGLEEGRYKIIRSGEHFGKIVVIDDKTMLSRNILMPELNKLGTNFIKGDFERVDVPKPPPIFIRGDKVIVTWEGKEHLTTFMRYGLRSESISGTGNGCVTVRDWDQAGWEEKELGDQKYYWFPQSNLQLAVPIPLVKPPDPLFVSTFDPFYEKPPGETATKEARLAYAKKMYPPGTVFRDAQGEGYGNTYTVKAPFAFDQEDHHILIQVDKPEEVFNFEYLYLRGKWGEIISTPKVQDVPLTPTGEFGYAAMRNITQNTNIGIGVGAYAASMRDELNHVRAAKEQWDRAGDFWIGSRNKPMSKLPPIDFKDLPDFFSNPTTKSPSDPYTQLPVIINRQNKKVKTLTI